jgi:acyl carrier protein
MTQSVNELVADILGLDPSEVDDDYSREAADNWDSLNHLRIITAVERSYSVSLTMKEIEDATSVRRLAELVSRKP